jgi:hypothetical protein
VLFHRSDSIRGIDMLVSNPLDLLGMISNVQNDRRYSAKDVVDFLAACFDIIQPLSRFWHDDTDADTDDDTDPEDDRELLEGKLAETS